MLNESLNAQLYYVKAMHLSFSYISNFNFDLEQTNFAIAHNTHTSEKYRVSRDILASHFNLKMKIRLKSEHVRNSNFSNTSNEERK